MTIKELIGNIANKTAAAAALGVTRRTIHNWASGRRPYYDDFLRLCQYAGVDPRDITTPDRGA